MVGLILGLFALPVLMVEIAILRSQHVTPWALFNILAYPLLVGASIAVHEAGHAVVARRLGLRVLRIEIGIGRRITKWRYGAVRLQLQLLERGP